MGAIAMTAFFVGTFWLFYGIAKGRYLLTMGGVVLMIISAVILTPW